MEAKPFQIQQYVAGDGMKPFQQWLNALRDEKAQALVYRRLARLEAGNLGDFKAVENIFELRIDYGPGYRVYFGKEEKTFVLLLLGGSKKTQEKDIRTAQAYWQDYRQRRVSQRTL